MGEISLHAHTGKMLLVNCCLYIHSLLCDLLRNHMYIAAVQMCVMY